MNKNKPKGFLSILLTLCMIVSILFSIVQVPTFAASEQFPDMPDN